MADVSGYALDRAQQIWNDMKDEPDSTGKIAVLAEALEAVEAEVTKSPARGTYTYQSAEVEIPPDAEGIDPHPYGDSYTGMRCGAMVMRHGGGDQCGLPADHPIHAPLTKIRQLITDWLVSTEDDDRQTLNSIAAVFGMAN